MHEAFYKIISDFLIKLNSIFYGRQVYPSVRAGIEMALISLMFFDFRFEKFIKSMHDSNIAGMQAYYRFKKKS